MLENWPIYYKDNLWISNPQSSNAVVTLWTPKELIAQGLDKDSFAVCGQLYSKRGINFILRNIFANPKIQNIVICGADRSESGKTFLNFLLKGIDDAHNVIDSEKAVIDKELPKEMVDLVRSKIEFVDLVNSIDIKAIQEKLNSFKAKEEFIEAQTFPEPEIEKPNQYPSELTTYSVRSALIKDAWPQMIKNIMKFGGEYPMIAGGKVKELTDLVTTITEEDPDKPSMTDDFDFNEEDLMLYIKNFLNPEAGSEDYNYGERIFNFKFFPEKTLHHMRKKLEKVELNLGFEERNILKGVDQFDMAYKKLKSFPQDRGGIVTLWSTGRDNVTLSKSMQRVPCLTFLQFMIRDEKLHLNAYFRSNDMFKAWPRNAFALRKLQKLMAEKLSVPMGNLVTISTLAQVYEDDWGNANTLIKKFQNYPFCVPENRGSIIIEVNGTDIIARHTSPDGNTIFDEYKVNGMQYKSAMRMCDVLTANNIFSNYGHSMDIGRELMKAEMAIKEGFKYTQDRDYLEIAKGMSTVEVMKKLGS